MKTYVISLLSREDRRQSFQEANKDKLKEWEFFPGIEGKKLTYEKLKELGFDTDHYWRDPYLSRSLTWGEVGCFLSHYRIWEECADSGENVLVLEDDAILEEEFDESWLTGDLTYLAHKEMMPSGVKGNRVCYPYWTCAYIITPKAAEALLDTDIDQNIIPVDEYLPRMTDRMTMTSTTKVHPRKRTEVGTDIEPRGGDSYVRDFEVHNWTCHDDYNKASRLQRTNPHNKNILDEVWKGGTMEGPGGGQKLNCIRRHLEGLPDNDVVIFTDGFDVFWTNYIDVVVSRFLEMKAEIVFAAEKYLWPNKHLRFPPAPTSYRYLNSGCFIGRVGELKRVLQTLIHDSADDQLYLQHRFLSGQYDIKLDYEGYIFQTNSETVTIQKGVVFNSETRCYGCIYHGNGGKEAKKRFERLYQLLYIEEKYARLEVSDYKVIGNEMLLVDFLTPTQCEEWIRHRQ